MGIFIDDEITTSNGSKVSDTYGSFSEGVSISKIDVYKSVECSLEDMSNNGGWSVTKFVLDESGNRIVKDISEVVNMANNTNYGLAGYIFTKDINTAWQVSEELQFGMVGINSGILSTEVAPFGGVKESGIGREGAIEGIDEYMEIKYLCFGNIL